METVLLNALLNSGTTMVSAMPAVSINALSVLLKVQSVKNAQVTFYSTIIYVFLDRVPMEKSSQKDPVFHARSTIVNRVPLITLNLA